MIFGGKHFFHETVRIIVHMTSESCSNRLLKILLVCLKRISSTSVDNEWYWGSDNNFLQNTKHFGHADLGNLVKSATAIVH